MCTQAPARVWPSTAQVRVRCCGTPALPDVSQLSALHPRELLSYLVRQSFICTMSKLPVAFLDGRQALRCDSFVS